MCAPFDPNQTFKHIFIYRLARFLLRTGAGFLILCRLVPGPILTPKCHTLEFLKNFPFSREKTCIARRGMVLSPYEKSQAKSRAQRVASRRGRGGLTSARFKIHFLFFVYPFSCNWTDSGEIRAIELFDLPRHRRRQVLRSVALILVMALFALLPILGV